MYFSFVQYHRQCHQHHDYYQYCRLPGTYEAIDGLVECSDEVLHIQEPFWPICKAVTNRHQNYSWLPILQVTFVQECSGEVLQTQEPFWLTFQAVINSHQNHFYQAMINRHQNHSGQLIITHLTTTKLLSSDDKECSDEVLHSQEPFQPISQAMINRP